MFLLLLVLLTVVGGAVAIKVAVGSKKQLGSGSEGQKALPSGQGDNLIERTVREVRVGDILTFDGRDFLCEGVIDYDEDGHKWKAGRVVDSGEEKWLVIGLERVGTTIRLMQADTSTPVSGYPPEVFVVGETRFSQTKRGIATCSLHGELGNLGELKKGRPDGHVERSRWWLYGAAADDTLLVEQWGNDYRVLRGKKVGDGMVELMPGS